MTPSLGTQQTVLPPELLAQGISLRQLLAILLAYRRQILIAALVAMVLAGVVSKLLLTRAYDATATVMVDYEVNAPDINREFSPMLAEGYMKTQTAFIGSAPVLGPVIDQLGWMSDPQKREGYSGPPEGLREHLMWKVMSERMRISNPQGSRLVYLSYQADTANEAAKVANAIAENYVREHGERLRAPARKRAEEYQKSVDDLKARMVAAQAAVAAYRQRTGLVDLVGKGLIEEERLRELNTALLAAETDQRNTAIRNRQVSRLRQGSDASDVEYAQSPGVVRIRQDLLTAETRFSELQKTLGSRHPDYLVAQAAVRELRDKLALEVTGFGGGVAESAGLASGQSSAMVQSLRERIDAEQTRLLKVRGQQDEVSGLLAELEAAEKLYKLALDQYGQVIRSAETTFNNASVIAQATPPVRHSKPKSSVNVVIGFVGGLICASLAALLWEFRRRRVRCKDDLITALGGVPLVVIGERAA